MSEYIIEGMRLSRAHPMYQDALKSAYSTKDRPLCMCRKEGVPMYIARLSDSELLVKRMPNTGNMHHTECESYEIPSELSGRGELDDKAVQEDQETGLTNLKLDFSLAKMSINRSGSMTASDSNKAVSSNPKKLSILSLLHYLYEEASLNKWSPRMAGKRNWYIVRKHLLEAASGKVTRKNPLSDFLLIPEVFKLENKDEITARRRSFMNKLSPGSSKQQMGILIGELKAIEPARFGHKLVIKHMPDTPIYLSEQVYNRINKKFDTELSFFYENESIHLLVISTFLVSASGNPSVDTISLMLVDRNWLPFESIHELEMLERLTTGERHFIKGLRYNLNQNHVIASVLLTDTPEPTAIYLIPAGDINEDYISDVNSVIEASALNSFVWDFNADEALKLPPA